MRQATRALSVDVLVVGTGTAAETCVHAIHSRKPEAKIAVADERPYGGTCAIRGCTPKKYFVLAAEAVDRVRALQGLGISGDAHIDWPALMASKATWTDNVPPRTEKGYAGIGVDTLHGHCAFTGPTTVAVGDDATVDAKTIVLANGAASRAPTFPGGEHCVTSDDFLELPTLPKRIIFIGGGFISFEFAHVAARCGAHARIVHTSKQPLKQFDQDAVEVLVEATRAAGIDVELDRKVTGVRKDDKTGELIVQCVTGCEFAADLVVCAIGRVPNTAKLGLDTGNVAFTDRGVTVDECLRSTTNPNVYAIGDVAASGLQLATVCDHEAKVAAENIAFGHGTKNAAYGQVASAVFTIPTMATVGMTEAAADKKGLKYRVNKGTTTGWPSSKRINEQRSLYKVLIEEGTGRMLGAHMVRHEAAEVINVFALAVNAGLTNAQMQAVLWAYPSYSSDIKYMIK